MTKEREVKVVDVGLDFTMTPGGRYQSEGEFSGEEFRSARLEPLLEQGFDLDVRIDRPVGMPSSFLEEAFGGLIRKFGPKIAGRVRVSSDARPERVDKVRQYIEEAIEDYATTSRPA